MTTAAFVLMLCYEQNKQKQRNNSGSQSRGLLFIFFYIIIQNIEHGTQWHTYRHFITIRGYTVQGTNKNK